MRWNRETEQWEGAGLRLVWISASGAPKKAWKEENLQAADEDARNGNQEKLMRWKVKTYRIFLTRKDFSGEGQCYKQSHWNNPGFREQLLEPKQKISRGCYNDKKIKLIK